MVVPIATGADDYARDGGEGRRDRSRRASLARCALTAVLVIATAACTPAAGDGNGRFTVALVEPDITTVPLMEAVERVREQGFDVDTIELAEPELAIEGLANGDYAISGESTSPALIAIERGAPIRIIADVIGNQWALYAQDGIASCDDLVGEPVGIFSEGAVATAMVRQWVAEECTAGEPEYLVIGGSDVRAQALLAGQITATALEVSDVVNLEASTGSDLNQLADFAQDLPGIHPQTVYANAGFLERSPEAAEAFVDALIDVHAEVNADPGALVALAGEHLGAADDDELQSVARAYVDAQLFDAGSLTTESVQATVDFFVGAGIVDPMDAADAADLSFLD